MIDVVEEVVHQNDPDAGKKKKKPSDLWTMMKDKAQDTGVQGVPNIGRAKHKVRKFFWTLVVIGGTRECSCTRCFNIVPNAPLRNSGLFNTDFFSWLFLTVFHFHNRKYQ